MVCGLVMGLSIYSFVVTAILVIISALFANSPEGTRITCKENHVDDNSKSQTHVDLFNVDISENLNVGNGENCSVIEILGFRVFKTIVLTLIFLRMIFVAFKMVIRIKHFLLKQTEKRALAEKRKLIEEFAHNDVKKVSMIYFTISFILYVCSFPIRSSSLRVLLSMWAAADQSFDFAKIFPTQNNRSQNWKDIFLCITSRLP